MSDLIEKLSQTQDIELAIRPVVNADSLRSALERGFVPVRFPRTKGGTELGIKLDPAGSVWSREDLSKGAGQMQLAGEVTLNYKKARFSGIIDISTLRGSGCLQPV
jgi:hypothetical protein